MPGTSIDVLASDAVVPASAASTGTYKNPFLWVPSSYLTMGLIYVTVTSAANIMFKNMGMDNQQATSWSSLLGLPYTIKPLWAPLLELYRTKKFFVVLMQFVIAGLVAAAALGLRLPGSSWMIPATALLGLVGLAGATQDIGSDGVYVTTLATKDQARYTGIQSMCWNIGFLLASSLFVGLSGVLHDRTGSWATAWTLVLLGVAAFTFLMGLYHTKVLPQGAKALDAPKGAGEAMKVFGRAFSTFFQKKGIWSMIAFAFFYRFGLGLLDKMGPLFIIDSRENGGLGLTNQGLSFVNGCGTIAFIVASILGGLFVARLGLKKSLLILCLCINIPNATFLYLNQSMTTNTSVIAAVVIIEKFGWGFGAVGHMIYMMQQMAPGPYKTAHYAFATAFMGLCMMVTGILSGVIQRAVGYHWFFIIVLVAATPSVLATLFAPFHQKTGIEPTEA
ncbi:MAG TPA: MFS transporter [Polyangia bacterium]|jgi:PAT family beta-lactamase induction signal transducer AmpG